MVDIEQEIKNNFSFIRSCCNRFLNNEEEQELLFSNVLEIIWRRKNNFDGSNFKGWVRVVVKNCFIDDYKKNNKYNFQDVDYFDFISSDDFLLKSNNTLFIENIFKSIELNFPKKYLVVFKEFIYSGKSQEQISEVFNLSNNSVRGIIWRIRNFIIQNKDQIESGVILKINRVNKGYERINARAN